MADIAAGRSFVTLLPVCLFSVVLFVFVLLNACCVDLAELRTLLTASVREANRKLLRDAISSAEAALAVEAPVVTSSPAPAPVLPHAASASPVAISVASSASSSPSVWYDEPSYGWTEAGEFVEILVTDERLRGVGSLPKESVSCDFTDSSFDLKIHGLDGRNFRVRVPVLDKNIIPGLSKCVDAFSVRSAT